ncbi:MAG: CAP domain-containing protein [Oscillospiraceae bacterium]
MKKKMISLLLAMVMLFGLLPMQTFAAGVVAVPSPTKLIVNRISMTPDTYLINQSNYMKLRDLAYMINHTPKNFEVRWDGAKNAINLTSKTSYTATAGDMTPGDGKKKTAIPNTSAIYVNGVEKKMTAYTIGGSNYFKLRDVMEIFNIYVGWDGATSTATIDTDKNYLKPLQPGMVSSQNAEKTIVRGIPMGGSIDTVIELYGKPVEKLKEVFPTQDWTVTHYVFAADYQKRFAIVQVRDDKIIGAYVIGDEPLETNDNVIVKKFYDSDWHKANYATLVNTTDGWNYKQPEALTDETVEVGDMDSLHRMQYYAPKNYAAQEKILFYVSTAIRVMDNRKPLEYSPEAAKASHVHSNNMAVDDKLYHDAGGILSATGVFFGACYENILQMTGGTDGSDPYRMVDAWYNSTKGHRKNLLDKGTFLGCGIGNYMGRLYATQTFYHTTPTIGW